MFPFKRKCGCLENNTQFAQVSMCLLQTSLLAWRWLPVDPAGHFYDLMLWWMIIMPAVGQGAEDYSSIGPCKWGAPLPYKQPYLHGLWCTRGLGGKISKYYETEERHLDLSDSNSICGKKSDQEDVRYTIWEFRSQSWYFNWFSKFKDSYYKDAIFMKLLNLINGLV